MHKSQTDKPQSAKPILCNQDIINLDYMNLEIMNPEYVHGYKIYRFMFNLLSFVLLQKNEVKFFTFGFEEVVLQLSTNHLSFG